MKNILLLTDYSENSINAMRYALHLFKDDLCHFYVLHVQRSTSYTSDDLILAGNQSVYNAIVKKASQELEKIVGPLENAFKNENFTFETIVDFDVLTDAIKQVIKSRHIDLIVIGTNGITGAKEAVFGSNTINVIRKINCTTLVIPEAFTYRKPKEVLLPLDLFDSISGDAFNQVVKFVQHFSNTLHLLRIKPHDEDSNEQKKDQKHISYFLKEIDYKYHVIKNVPMHYAVSCYSQTDNIDLVSLLVQKESLFQRFFIGSPTTRIRHKITVPLLIFHS